MWSSEVRLENALKILGYVFRLDDRKVEGGNKF